MPARVWILGAIVLSYSLWLGWDRILATNNQPYQMQSLADEAVDKRTAPIVAPADPEDTPREAAAAYGKSAAKPAHEASARGRQRPGHGPSQAPKDQVSVAASATESDSVVEGLPKRESRAAAGSDERLRQMGEPGDSDSPAEARGADYARALEILEGANPKASQSSQRFVLQVAALPSQEKAAELQAKLRGAGISSHTEKRGELIRVKVGPLPKDEADKVRAKLGRIGLSGFMIPL